MSAFGPVDNKLSTHLSNLDVFLSPWWIVNEKKKKKERKLFLKCLPYNDPRLCDPLRLPSVHSTRILNVIVHKSQDKK